MLNVSSLLILSAILIALVLIIGVAIGLKRQKSRHKVTSDDELRELRDKFARHIIKHDELIEQKKAEDTLPELKEFSLEGLYEMRSYLLNAYNRADQALKMRAKERSDD